MQELNTIMATARLRELGQLSPEHTVLMVCDIQENFARSIERFWAIVNNAERLMKASQVWVLTTSVTLICSKGCVNIARVSRSNHQSD